MPPCSHVLRLLVYAVAAVLMQPAWAAEPQGGDRVALLPPIDFNMEQDTFANEPVSDADPDVTKPRLSMLAYYRTDTEIYFLADRVLDDQ